MNLDVAAMQSWLNAHGAALKIDGQGGPKTRAAFIETFRNRNAAAAKQADKLAIVQRLGGTIAQLDAVAEVEGGGSGWDNSGLLKCLYERHYAWRRWRIRIPFLSDPRPGGYTIDANRDGINDSWEKVADACCRSGFVGLEFASWGRFQVMGAHWRKLGYSSPQEMVWGLSRGETAHYDLLARYIETFGLKAAFRAISGNPESCRAFAKGYNGPNYAKGRYHEKIAAAYRRHAP